MYKYIYILFSRALAESEEKPAVQSNFHPSRGVSQTYMEHLKNKFGWMAQKVPCFGISGHSVHVLNEPIEFYETFKVQGTFCSYLCQPVLLMQLDFIGRIFLHFFST